MRFNPLTPMNYILQQVEQIWTCIWLSIKLITWKKKWNWINRPTHIAYNGESKYDSCWFLISYPVYRPIWVKTDQILPTRWITSNRSSKEGYIGQWSAMLWPCCLFQSPSSWWHHRPSLNVIRSIVHIWPSYRVTERAPWQGLVQQRPTRNRISAVNISWLTNWSIE